MKNKYVKIYKALPCNSKQIAEIHYKAIVTSAKDYYHQDIITAWAKTPDESKINKIKNNIEQQKEIMFVAKIEDKIVGFGSVLPSQNILLSCYVDPEYGRMGIGTKIVKHLIEYARSIGMKELIMDASMCAEIFYKNNGFETVEYGIHVLANKKEMKCAKMHINLK